MFTSVNVSAQSIISENYTVLNELSSVEFKLLKEGYRNMLESETYDLVRKCRRTIGAKKNGLNFPNPRQDRKWLADSVYTKKWLTRNIGKSKFRSVDEAYSLLKKLLDLTQRQLEENEDVYSLLSRASKKQNKEIFDLELNWNRSRMLK